MTDNEFQTALMRESIKNLKDTLRREFLQNLADKNMVEDLGSDEVFELIAGDYFKQLGFADWQHDMDHLNSKELAKLLELAESEVILRLAAFSEIKQKIEEKTSEDGEPP